MAFLTIFSTMFKITKNIISTTNSMNYLLVSFKITKNIISTTNSMEYLSFLENNEKKPLNPLVEKCFQSRVVYFIANGQTSRHLLICFKCFEWLTCLGIAY